MGCLSVLVYVIIFVVTGIYFFFKRQFSFFERTGVPFVEPSIPFGNMKNVARTVHFNDRFQEIYDNLKKKGKVGGFFNLTAANYMITDVEILKCIAIKDFNTFMNRGEFVFSIFKLLLNL